MDRLIKSVILLILFNGQLFAETATPPQALNQWKDWVLEKHPDIDCPRIGKQAKEKVCAWPGPLTVNVKQGNATFAHTWNVYGKSWLPLPGNEKTLAGQRYSQW